MAEIFTVSKWDFAVSGLDDLGRQSFDKALETKMKSLVDLFFIFVMMRMTYAR
jgi:hypothetical protein